MICNSDRMQNIPQNQQETPMISNISTENTANYIFPQYQLHFLHFPNVVATPPLLCSPHLSDHYLSPNKDTTKEIKIMNP